MANSSTAQDSRAVKTLGRGKVTPYKIVIDTTATDLTVLAAQTDKMIAVVGASSKKTSAATELIFKSGSDEIGYKVIANGEGWDAPIKPGEIVNGLVTKAGEALKVQSDVALTFVLFLVVAESLDLLKTQ